MSNLAQETFSHMPPIFPPSWASDYGEDKDGVWSAFTYKGVRQVMRWMMPGEFMMGSQEDEPEREDNEIHHKVTLAKGYWLADTCCTQELWQAAMGENPSHFNENGEQRPVEQVSWEDVQKFLEKINGEVNLDLMLPTEAQWEYACRAGTTTPFSFGGNINTKQVNYNGNFPYDGAEKGEDRRETVDVKLLAANKWGLYQMHGNVWEWCQDWYGDYDLAAQIDPIGPEDGSYRLLRGGGWIDFAQRLRSAGRYFIQPGFRSFSIGFRVSRGHHDKQVRAAEPL